MAVIEATVTENINGKIKLSASRSGSCSGCAQSKACALSWDPINDGVSSPSEQDNSLFVDSSVDKISEMNHLKSGDTVKLSCNEKTLLGYICILFVPSLLALLTTALLISHYFESNAPTFYIVIALAFSLSTGATISHRLLQKYSKILLKNSIERFG